MSIRGGANMREIPLPFISVVVGPVTCSFPGAEKPIFPERELTRSDPRGIDVVRAIMRVPAMQDMLERLRWLGETWPSD